MAPATPAAARGQRKLTYEDYVLIPEDGQRHEIVDGTEYVSPAPTIRHQIVLANLAAILLPYAQRTGGGKVLFAPVDVLLSPHDIVEPDLLFVATERAAIMKTANIEGAPDLVIEVFSPSTRKRDETLKRERYRLLGVGEYWMVDAAAGTVRVVRWKPESETLLAANETLATPLLPGLEISLSAIFAA